LRPELSVSKTIPFAVDNFPVPEIPLIQNIMRDAKDVVGGCELGINKCLSCQEAALVGISMIYNTDPVLGEEEEIILILTLPDILKS
jgi:hypothetical protein